MDKMNVYKIKETHQMLIDNQVKLVNQIANMDDKKEIKTATHELGMLNRCINELFKLSNYYRIQS